MGNSTYPAFSTAALLLSLCSLHGQSPTIETIDFTPAGALQLNHSADPERYYVLFRGDTPASVAEPIDIRQPFGSVSTLNDPSDLRTRGPSYYRIDAIPTAAPWDLDSDGMDDLFELSWVFLNPFSPIDAFGDFDRDGRSNLLESQIKTDPALAEALPPRIVERSPATGEEMVNLTREIVLHFNAPIDPSTLTAETFSLRQGATPVAGRIVVSSTERFVTLFPLEPLEASTEYAVVIEGDGIVGRDGLYLDANGDLLPGGQLNYRFRTLPLERIEGTRVFGFVRDAMTQSPIEGVTIRVDAFPEANAVTDASGRFELIDVPAPEFFVHIDGTTAHDPPSGFIYPIVGKPFHSVAGQSVQLNHHGTLFDIYLPPMAVAETSPLLPGVPTQVQFGPEAKAIAATILPGRDPAVFDLLAVEFPADSAYADDGTRATFGAVIPVPPDRLPSPLPANLNPTLVISIQAGSATNFDVPAPVTFPNLDGLAPGAKATLWSFDHDAGKFKPIGSMTVSPDGATLTTDPGVGVLAPGWHFVSDEQSWGGDDGEPGDTPNEPDPEVFVRLLVANENGSLIFDFTPPEGPDEEESEHTSGGIERIVDIKVTGALDLFYESIPGEELTTESFTLTSDDPPRRRSARLLSLEEVRANLGDSSGDVLLGAQVDVSETLRLPDGTEFKTRRVILPYLYLDLSDDDANERLRFPDLVADGNLVGKRKIDLITQGAPTPELFFVSPLQQKFTLQSGASGITFEPTEAVFYITDIGLRVNFEGTPYDADDVLTVEGRGKEKTTFYLNRSDFEFHARSDKNFTDAQATAAYDALKVAVQARIAQASGLAAVIQLSDAADGTAPKIVFDWTDAPPNPGVGGNADSGVGFDVDEFISNFVNAAKRDTLSLGQQAFLTDELFQISEVGQVSMFMDSFPSGPTSFSAFILSIMADTIVHEGGHTFGLVHPDVMGVVKDIMDADEVDDLAWRTPTVIAAQMAFDAPYDPKQAVDSTLTAYLKGWANRKTPSLSNNPFPDFTGAALKAHSHVVHAIEGESGSGESGSPLQTATVNELDGFPRHFPVFVDFPILGILTAADATGTTDAVDLGTVAADGAGGAMLTTTLYLRNLGAGTLTLNSASLTSDLPGYSHGALPASLAPDETVPLTVTFDPSTIGTATGTLRLISDAPIPATDPGSVEIALTAEAIPAEPVFHAEWEGATNNYGGISLGSETVRTLTLSNRGAAPLTLTWDAPAAADFQLLNPPALPVSLSHGESLSLSLSFQPVEPGLRRGQLAVQSNAPNQPSPTIAFVGTGVPTGGVRAANADWGNDFIAIEVGTFTSRLHSNGSGSFSAAIPAQAPYTISIFDPFSGYLAQGTGHAGPASSFTGMTRSLHWQVADGPDSDGDGLPDAVEAVIGTLLGETDSDGDGVDDFDEVRLGLNPLDGLTRPIGVLSSLNIGSASLLRVATFREAGTLRRVAVVAQSRSLSIFDISDPDFPVALTRSFSLPGRPADLEIDPERAQVVVALDLAGVAIVDITDPRTPQLFVHNPDFATDNLELYGGLIYAIERSNKLVQTLDGLTANRLPAGLLPVAQHIEIEGDFLFAQFNGTVSLYDLSNPLQAQAFGNVSGIHSPFIFDGESLLASDGLPRGTGQLGVVDLSDLNAVQDFVPSSVDATVFDFAVNGSGLLLVPGANVGLQVFDYSDPANPALARLIPANRTSMEVEVMDGLAYQLVDGAERFPLTRLQVVNFQTFDNFGLAPSIELGTRLADADPLTPGLEQIAGRPVPLQLRVNDDVQVARVELLVNGRLTQIDDRPPFAFRALPPATVGSVSLQVRAVDTSGNERLSTLLPIEILPDTTPPSLLSTDPVSGSLIFSTLAFSANFDEALDPLAFTPAAIRIWNLGADRFFGGGDDFIEPLWHAELTAFDRSIVAVPDNRLTPGAYALQIQASAVRDPAGNALVEDVWTFFDVRPPITGITAALGTPHNPEAPSLNAGDSITVTVDIDPGVLKLEMSNINTLGVRQIVRDVPRFDLLDVAAGTATFILSERAATGDAFFYASVFGGSGGLSRTAQWELPVGNLQLLGVDSAGNSNSDVFPGNGTYVAWQSGNYDGGLMQTRRELTLNPGTYTLSFDLGGSHNSFDFGIDDEIQIRFGSLYTENFSTTLNKPLTTYSRTLSVTATTTARLVVEEIDEDNEFRGMIMDNFRLTREADGAILFFDDFSMSSVDQRFRLQIVPTLTSMDHRSTNWEGGLLRLLGTGFTEAELTIRYGDLEQPDLSPDLRPDVQDIISSTRNGWIDVNVPPGAPFGPITVITLGGESNTLPIDLHTVLATATNGTPEDPALPSANRGQTITVQGTGLDLVNDYFFLRSNGEHASVSRQSVNADGTEAVLRVPNNAVSGTVSIPGNLSGSGPFLQIVLP